MRLLGIDYGDKKIGLAFGETVTGVAVPLEVIINNGEQTIGAIVQKTQEEDIEKIIVGVPLSTGSHHDSGQLDKTRAFIQLLNAAVSIEVVEEDESFTTAESIRLQKEEGATAEEDALAAMLILQAYLNKPKQA